MTTSKPRKARGRGEIVRSGPYRVVSTFTGEIHITPAWPELPEWSESTGGGPGLGERMELARVLRALLNEPYTGEELLAAQERIERVKARRMEVAWRKARGAP